MEGLLDLARRGVAYRPPPQRKRERDARARDAQARGEGGESAALRIEGGGPLLLEVDVSACASIVGISGCHL